MLGGDGDDWMHGGAGQDLIQGDGDGGAETPHPTLPGVTVVADPNPASADVDRIFGGDSNGAGTVDPVLGGNGDAIWGGRGNDHTYGGRGDDMLDVHPDPQFPATWNAWAEADVESFHDIDIVYGGYDQDAMQANIADNGPIDGDRMFDWVGRLQHPVPLPGDLRGVRHDPGPEPGADRLPARAGRRPTGR